MLQTFPGVYAIKNKTREAVQRQPICIDYSDHDYSQDKIERRDYTEYKIKMNNYDK